MEAHLYRRFRLADKASAASEGSFGCEVCHRSGISPFAPIITFTRLYASRNWNN
jgi:hypothetical protein